ncbi:homeobox protein BEL1 homolog [Magnolia sinica]|uniref:homeobox protein BEL1 homolog n=1 Tax=Magnolia sinica TaxID=86752 RepID=UPI002657E8C2|nr:homeobox protein BEL1 homolog [Magnolia sinica]
MANEPREEKLRTQIASGFYYTDFSSSSSNPTIHHQLDTHMQSFEPNPELFNLQSGMEMLGSQWKNPSQQRDRNSTTAWKGFLSKSTHNQGSSSSSKTMAEPSSSNSFYQPDFTIGFSEAPPNENLIIAPDSAWQENRYPVDDSSLRCVFPCEGNERPSQGLSLSLCPNKPSNISLQSFELRETNHQNDIRFVSSNSRDGFFGKSTDLRQQLQNLQDGRSYPSLMGSDQQLHQLKNSKYLLPAQELLNEFCNIGSKQSINTIGLKNKSNKTNQWEEGASTLKNQSLYSFDVLELQKRKAKLVSMLDEVDRRYRQYCEQMRSVVSSFEGVAGVGSAMVYSSLALKAMSRHFRCLRDGIVGQIQATKKAMGEKDPVAPGTTRGETPRLKLLDQTLRQQRAIQQMGVMESHPWRPQRGLPERSVSVLRAWLFEHFLHPYPSDVDKHILARQTGLSRSQVSNWFINARVRLWKPMVEEMYLEEAKEQDDDNSSSKNKNNNDHNNMPSDGSISQLQDNTRLSHNPNPNPTNMDQKPSPDHLLRDSESLSSIINGSDKRDPSDLKEKHPHHQFSRADNFGVVDLDFSSYSHAAASTVTYANSDCTHPNFGSSGGVSLTLGLQQHSGGGVSLSFSPSASQHSLFFSRQQMEDCQPIPYSILDGEAQNLPYRNLMGAQLLHDLAG